MPIDILGYAKSASESAKLKNSLKGAYVCSITSFVKPGNEPDAWDINYYLPEKKEILRISVTDSGAAENDSEAPFKSEVPKKVDVEKVAIPFNDALKAASEFQKQACPEDVTKIFVSLYTEESELWSLSFICAGMKIFQVKIDAKDGRIIGSKIHDIIQKRGTAS